ncbi:hypothetical protein C8A01DRAFT_35006 [Parachaetomium inaequale]|uniref:Uncharacterized protein n=1 Tax=Parachaetomium inaequale TaxID=2588326 RepID=A0AAN6PJ73_9PEZI|nr:hypothetical protein C8A01DRAFT_35006 [Parachaetomium inaequale]
MTPTTAAQLPDGYEIRQLQREHLPWVQAIVAHTMSFDSPILSKVAYEGGPAQRAYDMHDSIRPSSLQSIESGLSYGVFWKHHKCKTPGVEGELKWDFNDASASREKLLEQMDFPLVSIAMSKDAAAPKSALPVGIKSWGEIVDGHKDISPGLRAGDGRPMSVWAPEAEGEVVRRSGTHTRGDHAGRGLSKALAHYVMREIAERGYRAILIHTAGDAVDRVWLNPPAPFRGEEISSFTTAGFVKEKQETGKMYSPFGDAEVDCKRIWVTWR